MLPKSKQTMASSCHSRKKKNTKKMCSFDFVSTLSTRCYNMLMQPSLVLMACLLWELMQLALAAPTGLLGLGEASGSDCGSVLSGICLSVLCSCRVLRCRARIVSHRRSRRAGRAPPVSLLPAGGLPPASTLINSPISSLHT